MKLYDEFENMFDKVCNDILNTHKNIGISFSGGVDSTAIALGFKKTGKDFYLIHVRNEDFSKTIGGRANKLWETCMSLDFSGFIHSPIIFLPNIKEKSATIVSADFNIKRIVTGNGMDRCYRMMAEGTREKEPTLGEDFHSQYPLLDKFLITLPRRFKYFNKSEYHGLDKGHNKSVRLGKEFNIEVINFAMQSDFIHFFEKYKVSLKDLFYPKLLTYEYVKRNLGMNYFKFCGQVYKNHQSLLMPIIKRVMLKIQK